MVAGLAMPALATALELLLEGVGMLEVSPDDACARVNRDRWRRECPEPRPLLAGVGVFPFQCRRQVHARLVLGTVAP